MDKPQLRVLLLADRFEVRGTSAYTLRLASYLPRHGVAVDVVTPDASQVDPQRRVQLPIHEYAHLKVPLVGWLVAEFLRRDLSRQPPDLIHTQSLNVLSQGLWLARQLGVPHVVTLHDYLPVGHRLRCGGERRPSVITVSASVKDDLLERIHLAESEVVVIHPGVEVEGLRDAKPVLDPDHTPVVGTAGPLESIKGLPFFLGAAQRVLAEKDDVQFLVSGAGPEEQNLRRLARQLGITSNVTFVPRLFDFQESLAAMDVFCLPSLRQGIGTIMLEAMALGKPVIATDIGGVDTVVRDNETGFVVPPSNSRQLAAKILELLNEPLKARSVGASAANLVRERFNVETMAETTAELYFNIVQPAEVLPSGGAR